MNTRTSKTALGVAVITALGTLGKAWIDSRSSDKLQTVVAAEVARNDQRWQAVEHLIASSTDNSKDITALREAVAGLKVSVEQLSRNQLAAARSTAAGVSLPEPSSSSAMHAADVMLEAGSTPAPAMVEAAKAKLFKD